MDPVNISGVQRSSSKCLKSVTIWPVKSGGHTKAGMISAKHNKAAFTVCTASYKNSCSVHSQWNFSNMCWKCFSQAASHVAKPWTQKGPVGLWRKSKYQWEILNREIFTPAVLCSERLPSGVVETTQKLWDLYPCRYAICCASRKACVVISGVKFGHARRGQTVLEY